MGGPVMVRGFELKHDITSTSAAQPCVAKGRARDVATETFECGALMGAAARVGSEIPQRIKGKGDEICLKITPMISQKSGCLPRPTRRGDIPPWRL